MKGMEKVQLRERILSLIDEYSKRAAHGARESTVLQKLFEEGVQKDIALDTIRELNIEGRVFQPVVGYLRRLR